jgi:hypothetical protein
VNLLDDLGQPAWYGALAHTGDRPSVDAGENGAWIVWRSKHNQT